MTRRRVTDLGTDRDLPVHRSSLLAAMFAASAVLCVVAVTTGRSSATHPAVLWGAAGLGGAVAAGLWIRRRSRQRPATLQAALLLFSATVAFVASNADTVNGVTTLGPAVIMVCVYAACFYHRGVLWVQIAVALGGYVVGAVLSSAPFAVVSVITMAGVAVTLAVMVNQLTSLLRRRIRFDPLTGVLSRAAWLSLADDALLDPWHGPLTVAMLDLDKFKDINDTLGHLAGDELLEGIASAWRSALGSDGQLGRFGGDEFVILFTDTDRYTAGLILRRLELAHSARWTSGVDSARPGDRVLDLLHRVDHQLRARKQGLTSEEGRRPT